MYIKLHASVRHCCPSLSSSVSSQLLELVFLCDGEVSNLMQKTFRTAFVDFLFYWRHPASHRFSFTDLLLARPWCYPTDSSYRLFSPMRKTIWTSFIIASPQTKRKHIHICLKPSAISKCSRWCCHWLKTTARLHVIHWHVVHQWWLQVICS